MLGSGRECGFGRSKCRPPLLRFRRLVCPTHGFPKSLVPGFHFNSKAVEPQRRARQARAEPFQIRERGNELAAVRLLGGQHPILCRFLHESEVRMANAAVAEPRKGIEGNQGRTGFQCCSRLNQPEPCERDPQLRDALLAGVERLGREQLAPRGLGVVLPVQRTHRPLAVGFHDIARDPPRLAVAGFDQRFDEPMRFIRAAVRRRVRRLLQNQPGGIHVDLR